MSISQHDLRESEQLVRYEGRVNSILDRRTSKDQQFYARVRRKPLGEPVHTFASLIDVHEDAWIDEIIDAIVLENSPDPISIELLPRGGSDVLASVSLPPLFEALQSISRDRADMAKAQGESAITISLVNGLLDVVKNDRHERNVFFEMWKHAENETLTIKKDLLEMELFARWDFDGDDEDPDVVKWRELAGVVKEVGMGAMEPLSGLAKIGEMFAEEWIKGRTHKPEREQDGKNGPTQEPPKAEPEADKPPPEDEPSGGGQAEQPGQAEEPKARTISDEEFADGTLKQFVAILENKPELLTPERLMTLEPYMAELRKALAVLEYLQTKEAEKSTDDDKGEQPTVIDVEVEE